MLSNLSPLAEASTIPLLVVIALLLVLLLISLFLMLRNRKWLKQLGSSATQLARGDLSTPIQSAGPPPVKALADTLNQMARQLDQRLSDVIEQRNEQEAILSSMNEGVIAVDAHLRIFSINRAACAILNLDPSSTLDQPIHTVIKDAALRNYLTVPMKSGQGMQGEIKLLPIEEEKPSTSNTKQPLIIEAQSAILRDAGGGRIGVVLVLHDVTHLRHLEFVRQEFITNVSHEIRTPISAVKAAVETLLDEFDEDDADASPDRQTLMRFLGIISRQSNRLHAIVEDLLSLTRIERANREAILVREAVPVSTMIATAIETCQAKATTKKISLRTQCETGLSANVNRLMIEQALINLIDNAIKYSPSGTRVEVCAQIHESELQIAVADQGRGIDAEHLPRLFERFYRTDKARSRDAGGTGLGLSIVKHIALTHGGRAYVESHAGKGSTFTIAIPMSELANTDLH